MSSDMTRSNVEMNLDVLADIGELKKLSLELQAVNDRIERFSRSGSGPNGDHVIRFRVEAKGFEDVERQIHDFAYRHAITIPVYASLASGHGSSIAAIASQIQAEASKHRVAIDVVANVRNLNIPTQTLNQPPSNQPPNAGTGAGGSQRPPSNRPPATGGREPPHEGPPNVGSDASFRRSVLNPGLPELADSARPYQRVIRTDAKGKSVEIHKKMASEGQFSIETSAVKGSAKEDRVVTDVYRKGYEQEAISQHIRKGRERRKWEIGEEKRKALGRGQIPMESPEDFATGQVVKDNVVVAKTAERAEIIGDTLRTDKSILNTRDQELKVSTQVLDLRKQALLQDARSAKMKELKSQARADREAPEIEARRQQTYGNIIELQKRIHGEDERDAAIEALGFTRSRGEAGGKQDKDVRSYTRTFDSGGTTHAEVVRIDRRTNIPTVESYSGREALVFQTDEERARRIKRETDQKKQEAYTYIHSVGQSQLQGFERDPAKDRINKGDTFVSHVATFYRIRDELAKDLEVEVVKVDAVNKRIQNIRVIKGKQAEGFLTPQQAALRNEELSRGKRAEEFTTSAHGQASEISKLTSKGYRVLERSVKDHTDAFNHYTEFVKVVNHTSDAITAELIRVEHLTGAKKQVFVEGERAIKYLTPTQRAERSYEMRQSRLQENWDAIRNHALTPDKPEPVLGGGKIAGLEEFKFSSTTSKNVRDEAGKASMEHMDTYMRQTRKGFADWEVELVKVNRATGDMTFHTLSAAQAIKAVGESLERALGKVTLWGAATSIMFYGARAASSMSQEIKDLESNTVLLARVGRSLALPGSEFEARSSAAKSLSDQLVAMTSIYGGLGSEAQRAAATYLRAGHSQQAAARDVRTTLIAQRIAEVEAADGANLLAAAMLQFDISGGDMMSVLDTLNTLSNNYRVTTEDLMQSISRAGGVFAEHGGKLSELASLTAVVAQETGRSGTQIGNAFKTISSRMDRLDMRETLFEKLGVTMQKLSGESKSFVQTLFEVRSAMDLLDEAERKSITTDMAGVLQRNLLVAALKNVDEIISAQQKTLLDYSSTTEGAGSSIDEFIQQNNTLDAALSRLKGNFSGLANVAQGPVGGLMHSMVNLVNVLLRIGNSFGGLPVKSALAIGSFVLFRTALVRAASAMGFMTIATSQMNSTLDIARIKALFTAESFFKLGKSAAAAGAGMATALNVGTLGAMVALTALVAVIDHFINASEQARIAEDARANLLETQIGLEAKRAEAIHATADALSTLLVAYEKYSSAPDKDKHIKVVTDLETDISKLTESTKEKFAKINIPVDFSVDLKSSNYLEEFDKKRAQIEFDQQEREKEKQRNHIASLESKDITAKRKLIEDAVGDPYRSLKIDGKSVHPERLTDDQIHGIYEGRIKTDIYEFSELRGQLEKQGSLNDRLKKLQAGNKPSSFIQRWSPYHLPLIGERDTSMDARIGREVEAMQKNEEALRIAREKLGETHKFDSAVDTSIFQRGRTIQREVRDQEKNDDDVRKSLEAIRSFEDVHPMNGMREDLDDVTSKLKKSRDAMLEMQRVSKGHNHEVLKDDLDAVNKRLEKARDLTIKLREAERSGRVELFTKNAATTLDIEMAAVRHKTEVARTLGKPLGIQSSGGVNPELHAILAESEYLRDKIARSRDKFVLHFPKKENLGETSPEYDLGQDNYPNTLSGRMEYRKANPLPSSKMDEEKAMVDTFFPREKNRQLKKSPDEISSPRENEDIREDSIAAAKISTLEEMSRLYEKQKNLALKVLETESAITIERKHSADEAMRAVGSLSAEDKIRLRAQMRFFQENPDKVFSVEEQLGMHTKTAELMNRFFSSQMAPIDPNINKEIWASPFGRTYEQVQREKDFKDLKGGRSTDAVVTELTKALGQLQEEMQKLRGTLGPRELARIDPNTRYDPNAVNRPVDNPPVEIKLGDELNLDKMAESFREIANELLEERLTEGFEQILKNLENQRISRTPSRAPARP